MLKFAIPAMFAFVVAGATSAGATPGPDWESETAKAAYAERSFVVAQAPPATSNVRPPTAAKTAPAAKKNCRREPIWGFRMSPFCKPTGICADRVIKGYRTVCS